MPAAQPDITFVGASPANCFPDRQGLAPEAVVLHIAEGSLAGCDNWFGQPEAQAGAHFCVGKDGSIHQYYTLERAPYANGRIEDGYVAKLVDANGRANPNHWTVSIEHEGHSGDPVPDAQFDASTRLTAWLFAETLFSSGASGVAIDRDHILRHGDISPSTRPNCPGWSEDLLEAYIRRVQELVTSDRTSAEAVSPAATETAGEETAETYTVQPGDTLSRIAARWGITVAALLAANAQVQDPDRISVGQQLTIPLRGKGAPPAELTGADLSDAEDADLGFEALWPYIEAAAARYDTDARVLAGIIRQESGFVNWRVHRDGTGHGLMGLDDNGLLPDFEQWSGLACGRGYDAIVIPPALQMEYLARTIAAIASRHGGDCFAAARQWHRGPGLMNDERGYQYQQLVQGHIGELFQ